MRPVEVEVKAEVRSLLPGADFADAFSLIVEDPDAGCSRRRAPRHRQPAGMGRWH